jgi:GNAT superfamily N-acetyltransferase
MRGRTRSIPACPSTNRRCRLEVPFPSVVRPSNDPAPAIPSAGMNAEGFTLRPATVSDIGKLDRLIAVSARELGRQDYTGAQIDAALLGAWGVDRQLILDGTYFVAEAADTLAGCGGWSYRKTLFGGDSIAGREPTRLDPATEPARIRAFFVHPAWSRRGIGTALLRLCEAAARAQGFRSIALMATLPGRRLYAAHGYAEDDAIEHPLPGGLTITFVPMHKQLD